MGNDTNATDGIPAAGAVVADRYQIEDILGSGGMGVVVAARHLGLGQRVAIKFLYPEFASRPDVVARFLREARAGASIQSEHVAEIYDVANLPNGAPYMVMEALTGEDLEKTARARGPLPIDEAVDYVLQACEGIAEAHAKGIVHRDLKTANLFLAQRRDGSTTVKILDFGISKMVDAAVALTGDATTLGSPGFISPEQLRSTKSVDHRTDIWALGVVLHRLITGSMPFDGARIQDCLAKILHDAPPPIRDKRPDAPAELEAIISKCLEKPLDRRMQDAADLAIALAPFGLPRSRASVDRVVRALRGANAKAPSPAPIEPPARPPAPPTTKMPIVDMPVEAPRPAPMTAPMARVSEPTRPLRAATIPLPLSPPRAEIAKTQESARQPPQPPAKPSGGGSVSRPAPRRRKRRNVLPLLTVGVALAVILVGWTATRVMGKGPSTPPSKTTVAPVVEAPTAPPSPVATPKPTATEAPAPPSSGPSEAPTGSAKPARPPNKPGGRKGNYLDRW